MRGIMGDGRDRLFSVPKRNELQQRINHTFRRGDRGRIATGTEADNLHPSVATENATIRRHLLHLAATETDMSHRLGSCQ